MTHSVDNSSEYSDDDRTWCRACYGSFPPDQLVEYPFTNHPDTPPICVHCIEGLIREYVRVVGWARVRQVIQNILDSPIGRL